MHCTAGNFKIALDQCWTFPLNQEAAFVFSDSLLRAFEGGQYADKKISQHLINGDYIRTIFQSHFKYMKDEYKRNSLADQNAIVEARDKRNKRNARNSRRDTVSSPQLNRKHSF